MKFSIVRCGDIFFHFSTFYLRPAVRVVCWGLLIGRLGWCWGGGGGVGQKVHDTQQRDKSWSEHLRLTNTNNKKKIKKIVRFFKV